MILEIEQYGHPALRAKGRKVGEVDARLGQLIEDMLETMHKADGVGLAAQQVAMPLQLCVVDVTGVENRPSAMWVEGQKVDPSDFMPLVLINPEVTLSGREVKGSEGCLSFPGITADIMRPSHVRVKAMNAGGNPMEFEAEGLLSRAVQHEFDHLQGVLFIDRMGDDDRKKLAREIEALLD